MTKSFAPAVFAPSTENFAYAASIVQTLDGLAAKRKAWESTDFKKANAERVNDFATPGFINSVSI